MSSPIGYTTQMPILLLLTACGLRYYLGWKQLQGFAGACAGRTIRLSTFVWDVAPMRGAGYVGEALGHALRFRPRTVPAIALHPRDVDQGYLPRALRVTRKLLARGWRPATAEALLQREPPAERHAWIAQPEGR